MEPEEPFEQLRRIVPFRIFDTSGVLHETLANTFDNMVEDLFFVLKMPIKIGLRYAHFFRY
jgi:hypothetical protein